MPEFTHRVEVSQKQMGNACVALNATAKMLAEEGLDPYQIVACVQFFLGYIMAGHDMMLPTPMPAGLRLLGRGHAECLKDIEAEGASDEAAKH